MVYTTFDLSKWLFLTAQLLPGFNKCRDKESAN